MSIYNNNTLCSRRKRGLYFHFDLRPDQDVAINYSCQKGPTVTVNKASAMLSQLRLKMDIPWCDNSYYQLSLVSCRKSAVLFYAPA